jgi:hypothetical protein
MFEENHEGSRAMKKPPLAFSLALTGAILFSAWHCSQRPPRGFETKDFLVGVKIYAYQGNLPELFNEWRALGINTAFVSVELASRREFRDLARREGLAVFLILPIFYNPEELQKAPSLHAQTDKGEIAKEEWVEFACPTREDFQRRRIDDVKRLIKELDPDGVSLDFIRYFVFWEKVYPDRDPASLPETCFDQSCIDHFQRETSLRLPAGLSLTPEKAEWILKNHPREWTDWKCRVIARMAASLAGAAREMKPDIKVNVQRPLAKDDYGGAIRSVAGQDLAPIGRHADFVSPMAYWHMVKRDPPWIRSVVEDVASQTQARVIPSIQVGQATSTARRSSAWPAGGAERPPKCYL